jgi:Protein of unknown function (DUF4242)
MKRTSSILVMILFIAASCGKKSNETIAEETTKPAETPVKKFLFVDVHNLEPGKVKFEDVAGAHQKDLATQGKYDVSFLKYWVDETQGKVYCLAESADSASIYQTHKEAHGLVPDLVHQVSDGDAASIGNYDALYFDIHKMGPGKVTADAVAGAHQKDLATQGKYGVSFINYWVDEKNGLVMCLAETPSADAMIKTHKEAHGLIPDEVHKVKQGE